MEPCGKHHHISSDCSGYQGNEAAACPVLVVLNNPYMQHFFWEEEEEEEAGSVRVGRLLSRITQVRVSPLRMIKTCQYRSGARPLILFESCQKLISISG